MTKSHVIAHHEGKGSTLRIVMPDSAQQTNQTDHV